VATNAKARIPEVGEYVRMHGTLVEVQDVTPPPPPVPELDYIFEDTEARIEVLANGRKIKDAGTMNNFYGKDTCVTSAIEDAEKIAAHYGEGVEVRVVKVTYRTRMRPAREENLYAPAFVDFRPLDRGSRWNLPDPVEEVVWSSRAAISAG
jgi:hypothetical protein